jgi:hypothetical protein
MSLKIPCLDFGEPPQCKQTPGGQKLRQLKTPQERAVIGRIFQALPTQTDTVALIYRIVFNYCKIQVSNYPKNTLRKIYLIFMRRVR